MINMHTPKLSLTFSINRPHTNLLSANLISLLFCLTINFEHRVLHFYTNKNARHECSLFGRHLRMIAFWHFTFFFDSTDFHEQIAMRLSSGLVNFSTLLTRKMFYFAILCFLLSKLNALVARNCWSSPNLLSFVFIILIISHIFLFTYTRIFCVSPTHEL